MSGIDDLLGCGSKLNLSSTEEWELNSCKNFQLCIKIQPNEMINNLYKVGKKMKTLFPMDFESFSSPENDTSLPILKWVSLYEIIDKNNSPSCVCRRPCIKNMYLVLEVFESNISQWEKNVFRYNSYKTDADFNRTLQAQHKKWKTFSRFQHQQYKTPLFGNSRRSLNDESFARSKEILVEKAIPMVHQQITTLTIASFDEEYHVHPSPSKIRRISTPDPLLHPASFFTNIEHVITSLAIDIESTNMETASPYLEDEPSDVSLLESQDHVSSCSMAGPSNVEAVAGPSNAVAGPSYTVTGFSKAVTDSFRIYQSSESSSLSTHYSGFSTLEDIDSLDFEEDTVCSERRQAITNRNYKFNFFCRILDIDNKLYNYILYNNELYNTGTDC